MATMSSRMIVSTKAVGMIVTVAMMIYLQMVGVIVCGDVSSVCPFEDVAKPVYPYWSLCAAPAVYGSEAQYTFQVVRLEGSLTPEWDESNSTYYVRVAEEGASYTFANPSWDIRLFVAQTQDVIITNADTGRVLAWRKEGDDEYFLVEVDPVNVDGSISLFQFVEQPDVSLPCPLMFTSRCQAYSILAYSSSEGLVAYEEDGSTYFKKGPSNDLTPFVIRRGASSELKPYTIITPVV